MDVAFNNLNGWYAIKPNQTKLNQDNFFVGVHLSEKDTIGIF